MDRLDEIFRRQKEFQSKVFPEFDIEKDTVQLGFHMIRETTDAVNEVSWKVHRRPDRDIIRSNFLEELIDIFKLNIALAIHWGFSAADFMDEFDRKSSVVEQRWHQEMELSKIRGPVAGVDIDGVLADYASAFSDFFRSETGISVAGDMFSSETASIMGVDLKLYEEIKNRFRESGRKANIPPFPDAEKFVDSIKSKGYSVVLLTARPYTKYKRMFADTISWAKKFGIKYDAILFDEDKNVRLYKEFGDDVKFFVEDDLRKAKGIADFGIKVFLINKSYNSGVAHPNIIRVNSLMEIIDQI